jgi:hypothetical protein
MKKKKQNKNEKKKKKKKLEHERGVRRREGFALEIFTS